MANTLNLGNGDWATKENSLLGYNSESGNYKPLAFDFTRASSATVVNKAGLIETAANGIPRIDFLGNTSGALKLEPQRTNLLPYSSDFSQWSLVNNITINPDSTMSPDGTLNASKVLEQVASANGHMVFDNLGLTPSVEYNFSIFVKKLNRRYVALQNSYNTQNGSIAFFDLDTETLVYTYSAGTVGTFTVSDAKIEKYNNGWYRLSANFQSDASTSVLPSLVLASTQWTTGFSYNNLYTGDITKGIYTWGAQLEAGSYPTSYIKTEGSAVTRNGDQVYGAGDAATFNDSEGVLMAETKGENDNTFNYISLSDGGTTNYAAILYTDTDNQIIYRYYVGGSGVAITVNSIDVTNFNKIAIKWKANDFAIWINGIEVGTASSGSLNPSGTFNELAFARGGANNTPFYGNTKQVQYFNTVLTDSELETLTSWTSFIEMAQAQNYNII